MICTSLVPVGIPLVTHRILPLSIGGSLLASRVPQYVLTNKILYSAESALLLAPALPTSKPHTYESMISRPTHSAQFTTHHSLILAFCH